MKKPALLAIFLAAAAWFLVVEGGWLFRLPSARMARSQKSAAVEALRLEINQFRKDATTLSPADAAKRWIELMDRSLAIPQRELVMASREERVDVSALVAALPPTSSWDAIGSSLAARNAGSALKVETLRLLMAVMRGDEAAWKASLEGLPKLLAAEMASGSPQRRHLEFELRRVTEEIHALAESDGEKVAAFEKKLARLEKPDAQDRDFSISHDLEVPDLVRFSDPKTAETLLLRALKLGQEDISVDGAETRLLAASLALKNIDSLKKPLWSLVHTLDHGPLYEAMSKKFPGNDHWSRDDPMQIYLLTLIIADRAADAVKLIDGHGGHNETLIEISLLNNLGQQGHGAKVLAFLQQLLHKDPGQPYWDTLIELAAQQGASTEALTLLRECLARPGLAPATRHSLQSRLYQALLAADRREEGIAILRELASPPSTRLESGVEAYDQIRLCEQLATLGRLLARQDLVAEALTSATSIIEKLSASDRDKSERVRDVAALLLAHQRSAEAEKMLTAHLAGITSLSLAKIASFNLYKSGPQDLDDCLTLLMQIHDDAGQFAKSLAVLEQSPHWTAPDLVDLAPSRAHTTPVLVLAARALAETGRTEEARRVILHAIHHYPGKDAAYQVLLRVYPGDQVDALLDQFAKQDRFEERPLIWKARSLLDRGRTDDAEKTIRAAIAIDPSDGEQGKGDRMRAYAILAEVLEEKGDAATAKIMRGAVSAIRKSEDADDWWEAGLLAEAVRRYEAALKDFADAYCIQSRLALRHSETGDFVKAEQHYIRAFELMPDSFGRVESHCFGCEGAFKGQRAQNAADKVFTLLASLPAAKPQVHYLLGYLREAQNRNTEAADAFRLAVEGDPDYLNAWKNLAELAGRVQMTREEKENAILQVFRLDPTGRHVRAQLRELRNLRQLWDAVLESEARQPAVSTASLLPLPAAKARLQSLSAAEREELEQRSRSFFFRNDPRQQLADNPLVEKVSRLVEVFGRVEAQPKTMIDGGGTRR